MAQAQNQVAAVGAASDIEEVLNLLKSRRYFVVRRKPDGVHYYTVVEYGTRLLVLPGESIISVSDVKIRPLEVQVPKDVNEHPKVKWLSELVGKPPTLKLFQYTFKPLMTRVVQRLDTGAEFHEVVHESAGPPVVMHVVHAYYVAYRSNSGRLYSETPGGARAYQLVERNQLRPPQVYVRRIDKHRHEIGVRVAMDEEQLRQLISYLMVP